MAERSRVVITGIGAIMPARTGREAIWDACLKGKSGIAEIRSFDVSSFPIGVAGEIADDHLFPLLPEEKLGKVDRFSALAMVASKEALDDSALDPQTMAERIGVYMGSGYSGRKSIDEQNAAMYRGGARRVHPRLMQNNITNAASGEVAIYLGLKGANLAYSVGYVSGSYAVVQAFNTLRLGYLDAILAGGAEAPILPLVLEEMMDIGEMSRRREDPPTVCSPFDEKRDGLVAAEGACVLVLERLESALSRRAPIYAELKGYRITYDRERKVRGGLRIGEMASTMEEALKDSGHRPEQVGYICASGLSMTADDVAETKAIKKVFGIQAGDIPVSSIKPVTGYAIAASEVLESAVCALAIQRGAIPPTINLIDPDRECDLDYVPRQSREAEVKVAMSNSFGIDGNYSAFVLEKYEGARP